LKKILKTSTRFKRKLASLLLFYKSIFNFTILISITLFLIEVLLGSLQPGLTIQYPNIIETLTRYSFEIPTYTFLGALGITHYIQKNQYHYYRNQGCPIKFLIISSWVINCFLGIILLVLSKIAGLYV
jgi:hypothetical protein